MSGGLTPDILRAAIWQANNEALGIAPKWEPIEMPDAFARLDLIREAGMRSFAIPMQSMRNFLLSSIGPVIDAAMEDLERATLKRCARRFDVFCKRAYEIQVNGRAVRIERATHRQRVKAWLMFRREHGLS